nr:hypothetical protein [Microbispora sp. GKU 823]
MFEIIPGIPIMLAGYGPAATRPATIANPATASPAARRPVSHSRPPSAYRNPTWCTASQTNATLR